MNEAIELQKEQGKQQLFDERSAITKKSMEPGLDMFAQHIKFFYESKESKPNFEKNMASNAAGLLRCRMSATEAEKVISGFEQAQLKIFQKTIEITKQMYQDKLSMRGSAGYGEGFWEVSNPNLPNKFYEEKLTSDNGEEVAVQRKEYFTFVPTSNEPYELLQEIIKFYDALFRAYVRIQEIAKSSGHDIRMKFKDNLKELLMDIDSAIIYVPDSDAGKIAREIVNEEISKAKVKTGREVRAGSGFDFKIGDEYFSHRQLIGKAVAKVMTSDYEGKRTLQYEDLDALAQEFLKRSEQAGKLSPQEMLASI
jgi:hypothetical protein